MATSGKTKKTAKTKAESHPTEVTVSEAEPKPKKVLKKKEADQPEAPVQISPEKQSIINQYQIKSGDTGSPEVQIALLTHRMEKLVSHLKGNPSDNHSRRGLLGIVSKRRRLLHYLEKRDNDRYKDIVKKIGLSK